MAQRSFIFMFALVRLSFSFLLSLSISRSLVFPLWKCPVAAFRQASRAQIITWWFPEKPEWRSWESWAAFWPSSNCCLCAALAGQCWAEVRPGCDGRCRLSMALNLVSPKFAVIIRKLEAGSVNPTQTHLRTANGVEFCMDPEGRRAWSLSSELEGISKCRWIQWLAQGHKRIKRVVYIVTSSHACPRQPVPTQHFSFPERITTLLSLQGPEEGRAILGLFTQKPWGIFWVILTFPFTHPFETRTMSHCSVLLVRKWGEMLHLRSRAPWLSWMYFWESQ